MPEEYKATLKAEDRLTPVINQAIQAIEKLTVAIEAMAAKFSTAGTAAAASANKVATATQKAASAARASGAQIVQYANAQGTAVKMVATTTDEAGKKIVQTYNRQGQLVGSVTRQTVANHDAIGQAAQKMANSTGKAMQETSVHIGSANKQIQRMQHGFVESVGYMVKSMMVWAAASAILAIALSPIAAALAILNLAQRSAEVDGIARSFNYLAQSVGRDSATMLEEMRKVSRGAISDVTLMKNANMAIATMGKQAAEKIPTLLRIAQAASAAYGRDVEETYQRLIQGIAKQEQELLDELGIRARATEAYKRYAKEVGKTVEQLSQQERVQAFLNEVLRQGEDLIDRVGSGTDTMATAFGRVGAQARNIVDTIGQALAPAFLKGAQAIGNLLEAASKLATKAAPYLWAWANAVADGMGRSTAGWTDGLNEMADTVDEWLPNMLSSGTELALNFAKGIVEGISYVVTAVSTLIGAVAALLEAHSPPEEGPFRRIKEWGADLINEYIRGFMDADYGLIDLAASDLSKQVKDKFSKIGKTVERVQQQMMDRGMDIVSKALLDKVRDKAITKEQAMSMFWPAIDMMQKASGQLRTTGKVEADIVTGLNQLIGDHADQWLLAGENWSNALNKIIGLNKKGADAEENYRRKAAALIHLDPRFKHLIPERVWTMSEEDKMKWLEGERQATDDYLEDIEREIDKTLALADAFDKFAQSVLDFQNAVKDIKVKVEVDLPDPEDFKWPSPPTDFDPFAIYRKGLEDVDGSVLTPLGKKLFALQDQWKKIWEGGPSEQLKTDIESIATNINSIATSIGTISTFISNIGREWDKLPPGVRDFLIGAGAGIATTKNPAVALGTGIAYTGAKGTAETIPGVAGTFSVLDWIQGLVKPIQDAWLDALGLGGPIKAATKEAGDLTKAGTMPTKAADRTMPWQDLGKWWEDELKSMNDLELKRKKVQADLDAKNAAKNLGRGANLPPGEAVGMEPEKTMYSGLEMPEDQQKTILDSISKPFEDAWKAITGKGTAEGPEGIIPQTITSIKDSLNNLVIWFGEQTQPFTTAATNLFKSFANAGINVINAMGAGIVAAFQSSISAMVEAINSLIDQYNVAAEGLGKAKLPRIGSITLPRFQGAATMLGGGYVPKIAGMAKTPIWAEPGEKFSGPSDQLSAFPSSGDVNFIFNGNINASDPLDVERLIRRISLELGKDVDANKRLAFGRKRFATAGI